MIDSVKLRFNSLSIISGMCLLMVFLFWAPHSALASPQETTIDSELIEEIIDDTAVEKVPMLIDEDSIADLDFAAIGESPTTVEQLKALQEHVAELYEKVEPAVVNVNNGMGQGSGVVVSSDGYILTAAHVISTPNLVAEITFPDGTKAKARTLGLARGVDAGLLKIFKMSARKSDADADAEKATPVAEIGDEANDEEGEEGEESDEGNDEEEAPDSDDEADDSDDEAADEKASDDNSSDEQSKPAKDRKPKSQKAILDARFKVQDDLPKFPYLDIGDSTALNLGQWIIAIGHPGGLDEKRGLVLRLGRINRTSGSVIRTDCTLVGGDSGGPLIDLNGDVIGIHSRIGGSLRDNFHVPTNQFLTQWRDLIEPIIVDGSPYLGVTFRDRSNVIDSLSRVSPARRSGLEKSDRIIRIGDREIYDLWQLRDVLQTLKPFQEIEFEVQRKGEKKTINVVIGEQPSARRR